MYNIEKIKEISMRMRTLREIADLSPETLAIELKVDAALYLEYEAARCDIPIGFLTEFANRFGVNLMTMLTGDEPKLHVYEVVRKDAGLKIERRKQYGYSQLAYNFSGKTMEPFLVTVPASDESTPFEVSEHVGQEFNYILSGTMKILIDQHEIALEAGDSIYFNAKYKHGMKALNGKEAKFLAIISQ